jgi:hypothetical protein
MFIKEWLTLQEDPQIKKEKRRHKDENDPNWTLLSKKRMSASQV